MRAGELVVPVAERAGVEDGVVEERVPVEVDDVRDVETADVVELLVEVERTCPLVLTLDVVLVVFAG